jgi:hypothetical protein
MRRNNRGFRECLLKDHKINAYYEYFQSHAGHIVDVMPSVGLNKLIIVETYSPTSSVIYNRDLDYTIGLILYNRAFIFDRYKK